MLLFLSVYEYLNYTFVHGVFQVEGLARKNSPDEDTVGNGHVSSLTSDFAEASVLRLSCHWRRR